MGVIAESLAIYAQPLLADTDGSIEELNKAMGLAQLCWNLALLSEDDCKVELAEMGLQLKMEEDKFEALKRAVILPMIRRHKEMFPLMHAARSTGPLKEISEPRPQATRPVSTEKYPGTGRNEPCPCKSGKKYKRCCGQLSTS